MHCPHFICERNFYARTHVKITRHWNSTLRDSKSEVCSQGTGYGVQLNLSATVTLGKEEIKVHGCCEQVAVFNLKRFKNK